MRWKPLASAYNVLHCLKIKGNIIFHNSASNLACYLNRYSTILLEL